MKKKCFCKVPSLYKIITKNCGSKMLLKKKNVVITVFLHNNSLIIGYSKEVDMNIVVNIGLWVRKLHRIINER